MANQAKVQAGDFVYDPFAGSCSIPIACAHFNAFVFASELDVRVLNGSAIGHKSYKPEIAKLYDKADVFTNYSHYGLEAPEVFCQNVH